MMLTEADAKTRWCPHVGARASPDASPTTRDAIDRATRCIGSACMAWRFAAVPGMIVRSVPPQELASWQRQQPNEYIEVAPIEPALPPVERMGYCGLAGKP